MEKRVRIIGNVNMSDEESMFFSLRNEVGDQ
jgi:hypothetical protein